MLDIVNAGVHRSLRECQKLFKNEVWDCSFYNKNVTRKLPDFVQRTLSYGMNAVFHFMYHRQSHLLSTLF